MQDVDSSRKVLVRKKIKRSKRDLRGLYETLAPRYVVSRKSPSASVIKEPGLSDVRVRKSNFSEFGSKTEWNTELWQYAQRDPLPYKKINRVEKRPAHEETTIDRQTIHGGIIAKLKAVRPQLLSPCRKTTSNPITSATQSTHSTASGNFKRLASAY